MKKLLIAILLATAACSGGGEKHPEPMSLYSPNGEPLNGGPLGMPGCETAMGNWFDRLSAGGKGHISALAFLDDAQTQFRRMDIDHNGYIVSEELDRFRAPYHIETAPVKTEEHKGKHKGKEEHDPSNPALSLSDPVMSADTNLDFKVTPQEFAKQAEDTFAKLDANHDGQLDRAEVMTLCEKNKP